MAARAQSVDPPPARLAGEGGGKEEGGYLLPPVMLVVVIVLGAAALFAGLALHLRAIERSVAPAGAIAAQLDAGGAPRPVAGVLRAVRAMKLVTVEIDSTVTATAENESWRGDVSATLRAPVRFYYGTDLSGLADGAFSFSPILNEYVVRVPRPGRLATEVYPEAEAPNVQVGWGRFRSRAGEYYIGLARRALLDRARAMTLSPEESRRVEDATRDQVAGLVRAIAGDRSRVSVVFEDERPSRGLVHGLDGRDAGDGGDSGDGGDPEARGGRAP